MNNLEKYRERKVASTYDGIDDCYHYYRKGFNAAIALELPIKFAKWLRENYSTLELHDNVSLDSDKWRECFTTEEKTAEELYKYWIENIFKP